MRQRLLLVAGWVAAAVAATLVSTGAVAVAGGQVTDRPLPPLSASEVAAWTEGCGSSDRAPCLRQLEGSAEPTTTVAAAPETLSPEGDGQGVSPISADSLSPEGDGQGASSASPESHLPPEEDPLESGDDAAPLPSGEVVTLVGATVGVSGADGEVHIVWAIPSPGYALVSRADTESTADSVTMVFLDGLHRSTLTARWDDVEGLVIETTEGRLEL